VRFSKNESVFDTLALRSLFCEVHNRMATAEGRLKQWERLDIKVTAPKRHLSGEAAITGTWMVLRLPPHATPYQIAALMHHELQHSYGYRHAKMLGRSKFWEAAPQLFAWAGEMFPEGLPKKPTPAPKAPPSPVALLEQRLARLTARAEAWKKKRDRAVSALHRITKDLVRTELRRAHLRSLAADDRIATAQGSAPHEKEDPQQ